MMEAPRPTEHQPLKVRIGAVFTEQQKLWVVTDLGEEKHFSANRLFRETPDSPQTEPPPDQIAPNGGTVTERSFTGVEFTGERLTPDAMMVAIERRAPGPEYDTVKELYRKRWTEQAEETRTIDL